MTWRRTSCLQGPQMPVGMVKMIMEGGVLQEEAMKFLDLLDRWTIPLHPLELHLLGQSASHCLNPGAIQMKDAGQGVSLHHDRDVAVQFLLVRCIVLLEEGL